jgi:hypothetical protein
MEKSNARNLAPLGRVWQVGESCGQVEARCTGKMSDKEKSGFSSC